MLSRPDKLRATRTGGYSDVELVADGKTVSIVGKNLNAYTQRDVSGSVDDLIGRLRDDSGLDLPGADLILARGYDDMMSDVVESAHIGRGVVDGVECEHLAFRGEEVDWQIWVEMGPRPIPRKYVITSKSVGGGPQYTIRVKDWKSDVQIPADAFAFTPAPDMKKVDLSALANIDEILQAAQKDQTAIAIAALCGLGCLFVSDKTVLTGGGGFVTTAAAIIGRPLTPLSYAGVARRTTRRAVVAGAAIGAAAVARPVVVAPTAGCMQAVDAYGRNYTRCY